MWSSRRIWSILEQLALRLFQPRKQHLRSLSEDGIRLIPDMIKKRCDTAMFESHDMHNRTLRTD